ncbi:MAG: hypothetical protein JWO67_3342 [Streptosporangiaceae bacterium]|nr:hypothetical protein [Streptosporangiaceae bacterium]
MPMSLAGSVLQRPDLDREGDRPGQLAAPLEGGVEIWRLDDREPAEVLLALTASTSRMIGSRNSGGGGVSESGW